MKNPARRRSFLPPDRFAEMTGRFALRCIACDAEPASSFATSCGHCGGLIDAFYPLDRAKRGAGDNPYLRYRDLLPVRDRDLFPDAGMTPTIHARALGKR